MQKLNFSWKGLLFFLFFCAFLPLGFAGAAELAPPTILQINTYKVYAINKPVIAGLCVADSDVLVYLNEKYVGKAIVRESSGPSNDFYFQFSELEAGNYEVSVRSEDRQSATKSSATKKTIQIKSLAAPTLIRPNEDTITGKVKPFITGLSQSGTFVHVFLDGRYNGRTKIIESESGTANFAYQPFLNLAVGKHSMWAIAEDLSGRKSPASRALNFNIERQMPAPTLVRVLVNENSSPDQPFIAGLAKNNSRIKVFIDQRLNGEFVVKNNESGTANFAYQSFAKLKPGKHIVYTTSIDARGKESRWSNFLGFYVGYKASTEAKISPVAVAEEASEEEETENEIKKLKFSEITKNLALGELLKKGSEVKLSKSQYERLKETMSATEGLDLSNNEKELLNGLLSDYKEETEIDDKNEIAEIEKLLDKDDKEIKTSSTTNVGSINENKESQSKISWNLLIFLLFLVAVILWIFWVNRELIKEKRENDKKNNKEKETK